MGKPKNCGKILRRLTCQRPLLKIAIVGRRGGIPAGKPTSRTLGRFLRWYAFTAGGCSSGGLPRHLWRPAVWRAQKMPPDPASPSTVNVYFHEHED